MKKTIQTALSIGVFCLLWYGFKSVNIDMSTISKWSDNATFFWILWGIEAIVMLWWLLDDMRLTHMPVNPSVFVGWLWLLLALILFFAHFKVAAFVLVGIPAIPLAFMALFITVVFIVGLFGPIRWN